MTGSYVYPAVLKRQGDGSYAVRFADLPEALTFGTSLDDALASAEDCLREAIRGRIRDNEALPMPSNLQGAHLIALPAEVAAKAAIYDAFRRSKVTKVALAEKLQLHEGEVRRILDPDHRTKLDRLDQAAKALGGRLDVSFTFKG